MNIGQASEASGVSQRMIRHYEAIGLIPAPARRDSGYRIYSAEDVSRLRFIATARDLGLPTGEIAEMLAPWGGSGRSAGGARSLALARADELGRKAEALLELRATLLDLVAARDRGDRGTAFPHVGGNPGE